MGAFNHMNGNQQGGTYGPASTAADGGWGGHRHTLDASFTVEDFHVYAAEVTPEKLTFAVDGQTYFEYVNDRTCNTQTWPFAQRFNFILNIAVGGGFGGYCLNGQAPTFSDTNREMGGSNYREMEVDWVRVYQKRDGYPRDPCAVYTSAPTPAPASSATSCLTAVSGDVCYGHMDYARDNGNLGLNMQSSDFDAQMAVHNNQVQYEPHAVTCQQPCPPSPTACFFFFTARRGAHRRSSVLD